MPQKRKRPDEDPAESAAPAPPTQPAPPPATKAQQQQQQPPVARRATRHTPVQPPPIPPQYQQLVQQQQQQQKQQAPPTGTAPTKPGQPPALAPATQLAPAITPPEQQKRGRSRPAPALPSQVSPPVLSWTPPEHAVQTSRPAAAAAMGSSLAPARPPSDLVAPEITYHVPQSHPASQRTSSLVRPHGPSAPPPRLHDRPPPMTVTPVYPPKPPTISQSSQSQPQTAHAAAAQPAERHTPRADRNIDKVVLGNICFSTWYPSYYGKEVLGDSSGNHGKTGSKDTGAKDQAGGKASSRKERDHPTVLERLYVCPRCFKYSKELVPWWGHVRICEQQAHVPGRKVYIHPRGRRKVLVPQDGKGSSAKKRRGDGGAKYVEEFIQDEGEWSIWEVDGEKDPLFCQNLSLFAKLFLDNKSVFFDVSGFNYFLLVYTPPAKPSAAGTSASDDIPRPQITGFFSKEKMSWDNNNLACILVFPPWQRKGLGALLMGASYEISRREGILGGPEKPISDLGKKGYKRFWAGEIARWLLGIDLDANSGDEVLVDVNDCSQATWIHPEDCLLILRDMGIIQEAGIGLGKPEAKKDQLSDEAAAEKKEGEATPGDETDDVVKTVPRVRVDKQAVRRYVSEHRINLERTCDAEGFVEGYAMKASEAKDGEQDEDEEEE